IINSSSSGKDFQPCTSSEGQGEQYPLSDEDILSLLTGDLVRLEKIKLPGEKEESSEGGGGGGGDEAVDVEEEWHPSSSSRITSSFEALLEVLSKADSLLQRAQRAADHRLQCELLRLFFALLPDRLLNDYFHQHRANRPKTVADLRKFLGG